MILKSPKSFDECLSILKEQVEPLRWYSRIRLFSNGTSSIIGIVNDDGSFALESSRDYFSKRFIGYMKKEENTTQIEGQWAISFLYRIFGSRRFDEEEIMRFLKTWLEIEIKY